MPDSQAQSPDRRSAEGGRDKMAQILDSLPTGFMLMDAEGRVLMINNKLSALLGLSPQAATGRLAAEFWPKTAQELVEVANSSRQASGLIIEELDGCFLQATPITEPAKGLAVCVFDRRLWQPFLESAPLIDPLTPYYKKIFESSTDGLSICDKEGRLIMVNRASAEHVGIPAEQMIGRHVDFLVKHRLIDNTVCVDVLETKKPVTKLIRHYQSSKYILLTGNPIFSPDGEVQLVVINERDLTGMIKLQTSFNQQSELLARFKDELTAVQLSELAKNDIVSLSNSMRRTLDSAVKLARYGVREILITGESGTGKGLIAKFIHSNSPNSAEPFIHLNCAAMPETLLETELFGYEKGLFTGASPQGRAGLIEAAGGGALFLDEIGEMPLSIQAKLLTFLDNHEFRRVGGTKAISSPCSVIAATNRNLDELVSQKLFRQDLYYRLGVFCLHLPPLRERPEDALELASRELSRLNARYGHDKTLDPLAIEILRRYDFPGNVRELLNCVHQSVLLSSGREIGPFIKSFLESRGRYSPKSPMGRRAGDHAEDMSLGRSPLGSSLGSPLGSSPSSPPQGPPAGSPAAPRDGARPSAAGGAASRASGAPSAERIWPEGLEDKERNLLIEALTFCQNTREMARFLGISQASVSRKLKKHNLVAPGKRRLIQSPHLDS